MNKDLGTDYSSEFEYQSDGKSSKGRKFRAIDVLIFIICLFMAFVFWCYALYVDDPVIEKSITVNFVVDGGDSTDILTPASRRIVVYGKRSELNSVSAITVKIKKSEFKGYDTPTTITIQYPKNISSDTKQIVLKLTKKP